jgi:hypothetical protein
MSHLPFVKREADMSSTETLLAQRLEMAEKFAAEAQGLIRAGKNAGAVLRKLQAVRNVCTGRVEEAERAEDAVANAPLAAAVCDCALCTACRNDRLAREQAADATNKP